MLNDRTGARVSGSAAVVGAAVVALLVVACSAGNVGVHGVLTKEVGRACSLLTAAFPSLAGRTIAFTDDRGMEVAQTVSGPQRDRDTSRGSCLLTAPYSVTLPVLSSYSAKVSSQLTDLPPTPAIAYDALAAQGFAFDIAVPPVA